MFARSWYSSEGEDIALNIGNICGRFAATCSEHEGGDIFLLLDSADSGLSIDNVVDLKDILQDIIRTMSNGKNNIYIIISANEYELAADENCLDVSKLRYVKIRTYGRYRQAIMGSRSQKDRLYQEKSGAEPCPSGE